MTSPPKTSTFLRPPKLVLVLLGLMILLAAGLAAKFLYHRGQRYQGKSLNDWLQALVLEPYGDPQRQVEATNAIRALGPRAIPGLIALLKHHPTPTPVHDRVENWLNNHPLISSYVPYPASPHEPDWPRLAITAFKILGPDAKSAAPELVGMLGYTDTGIYAAQSLQAIGPESLPALTQGMDSTNLSTRIFSLKTITLFGPAAWATVPQTAAMMHDPDRLVAGTAMMTLGEMGSAAQPYLSELEQKLADTNYSEFAGFALARLDQLEPLLLALTNKQPQVRLTAAVSLNPSFRAVAGIRVPPDLFFLVEPIGSAPWVTRELANPRGAYAGRRFIQILLANFEQPEPGVRILIAERLGDYGVKAWPAIPALTQALSDKDERVRQSAAAALKKIDVQLSEGGVIRGPRSEKKIALEFTGHTFAEGGETILNELAKHHALASFFVTGDFLDNTNFQPLVERILNEGHYLGAHGGKHLLYCPWDGPKDTLVTHQDFIDDLTGNLNLLMRSVGNRGYPSAPRLRPRYWLPAYEWYNQQIVEWSRELRLALVSYTPGTRSNADYTEEAAANFISSQAIYDSILKREQTDPNGLNGYLLLLHLGAGPGRTDKFADHHFGELLDYLTARGYQFVRIDDLLDPRQ